MKLFEVKDKTGRNIYLTKERWKHIVSEHPEMSNIIEEVKETLKRPLKITQYSYDEDVRYYYTYLKRRIKAQYLLVIVKYLNRKGYIITSYFVRHIK